MPVAQISEALDDVQPQAGAVYYGGYTNDTAPLIRVNLGDQGVSGATLQLADNGASLGSTLTLTASDVSRGYVDVPVSGLSNDWHLFTANIRSADGASSFTTSSFALGVATAIPDAPTIAGTDDDAGARTGALADGARTDDATPTFHITEPGLPPPPAGSPGHAPYGGPALLSGHLELFENGRQIGDAVISYGGAVTITPGTLSAGDHVLTAVAVDRAGNVSAPSAPFHLTVGPDGAGAQPVSGQATEGDDQIQMGPGLTDVFSLGGADTIHGGDVDETIRGGAGQDVIYGGAAYNEINGNQGQDTIYGRSTVGDSIMGGQGNDLIDVTASAAHNKVNGNLGDDLIHGGSGGDTLWGGQGDDVIVGGSGADWISGDLGSNTVTGGAGADTFHALANGFTRVTDFHVSEGDRVQVDAGVAYTYAQSGADVVVDLGGHGQIVLADTQLGSLSPGWIFQA